MRISYSTLKKIIIKEFQSFWSNGNVVDKNDNLAYLEQHIADLVNAFVKRNRKNIPIHSQEKFELDAQRNDTKTNFVDLWGKQVDFASEEMYNLLKQTISEIFASLQAGNFLHPVEQKENPELYQQTAEKDQENNKI